jgi:hypothetical protein
VHLVPERAIVDETNGHVRTFADMRQAMILQKHSLTSRTFGDDLANAHSSDVSIGCGFAEERAGDDHTAISTPVATSSTRRRRLQHVENAGACNNVTNFYCWMSCLDIPNADQAEGYLNEGYSLYCVDPSVLAATGGQVSKAQEPCTEQGIVGLAMQTNCMGSWHPTAPGAYAQTVDVQTENGGEIFEEPYCYGGTSMYMDGFHWLGTTCVIYLFPRLVLDSPGAMVAACLFTIAFGIALEWVIQRRRVTVQKFGPGYPRLCVSACFYGLQLTMGYTIMLVIMIYSIPLFLSVVLGIVGGHVLFSAADAIVSPNAPCYNKAAQDNFAAGEDDDDDALAPCCGSETESGDTNTKYGSTSPAPCCKEKTNGKAETHCKGKAINNGLSVAEGSTPCCQHTL